MAACGENSPSGHQHKKASFLFLFSLRLLLKRGVWERALAGDTGSKIRVILRDVKGPEGVLVMQCFAVVRISSCSEKLSLRSIWKALNSVPQDSQNPVV